MHVCVLSHSALSYSLQPHRLQHARLLCPPLFPVVCSNSCPLSQWWFFIISSSAAAFPFAFNLFQHSVFSNKFALCIRWPKYWSFSFNISPSNEYSRLISFRIDWFDLLAVQGNLKSLLQHHNLKALILQCSAFLWSNSHIHKWLLEKNHSLDYTDLCQQSDVSAFNTLSRSVIADPFTISTVF